jgi:hypothetical protein
LPAGVYVSRGRRTWRGRRAVRRGAAEVLQGPSGMTLPKFPTHPDGVGDRVSGLGVPDLLLHQHAALECRPGHLGLERCANSWCHSLFRR